MSKKKLTLTFIGTVILLFGAWYVYLITTSPPPVTGGDGGRNFMQHQLELKKGE